MHTGCHDYDRIFLWKREGESSTKFYSRGIHTVQIQTFLRILKNSQNLINDKPANSYDSRILKFLTILSNFEILNA